MEVTSTKAALVGNGDVDATSRLKVTLPRYEVEAALAETEQPELVLDVLRGVGPDRDAERHSISVAWDPGDIEKLLKETPGDAITFAFDPDEIERLIDYDVEAHGLREKALVLSVAVGVAATSATGAMAGYDQIGPPDRPVPATATAHDEQTLDQRGIVTPAAAVNDERTLADRGIEQAAASRPDEATLAQRGIEQTAASRPDEATLAQRGIDQTAVSRPDEATLAQRGIPDNVVGVPDEAGLTQRGIETPAQSPSVAVSADDGFAIDPSTGALLGLAGGMGLLIAGAAFVARRQRAPHPA